MKIGILGGSFDPVHNGHIQTAKNVLSSLKDIEQVWLVPALRNPFKDETETPYDGRYIMCQLATENIPNVYASDAEYDIAVKLNKRNLFTTDVLNNLPSYNKYYFIVGADCIARFHMWNNYKEILDKHGLIVVPRPGYTLDYGNKNVAKIMSHPNVIMISDQLPYVYAASSDIRDAIHNNKHPMNLPEKVYNFIFDNNLYV